MNRITRLQEMAAKAEQELQDFEACFDEQDGDHVFKGVGCLERIIRINRTTVQSDSTPDSRLADRDWSITVTLLRPVQREPSRNGR